MKINTSSEIYSNLYDNIYKTLSGLNSPNLKKELVAKNYVAFLTEAQNHMTLAEIAKNKAKQDYRVFNQMQFNSNLVALENYAPVKVLLDQYNSKFNNIYQKTGNIRKTLIEMENIEYAKTNSKLDKTNKTFAKIKSFLTF